MSRYARWSAFLLAIFCVVPSADAGTGPKRKVHVIVAGLTSDRNIGRSVEYNINQVKKLMENGLADAHRGEMVMLKDSRINGREILATIDRLRPGPNDAIFMYYHGHGAYDSAFAFRDPSGGHYFDIPSGDLMRKDLWDHLRARKAKLTVLVTETCYVPASAHPFIGPKTVVSRAAKDLPVLASLLLSYNGFIDVNACSKNESSWNFAAGRGGSFFTDTFVNTCYEAPFKEPGKVTWAQFLGVVSTKASNIYKKLRSDVLANADRYDRGLVDQVKRQPDQRAAIIQASLTRSGVTAPEPPGPVVGSVREVGAGLSLSDRLDASDPRDAIRRDSYQKAFLVRLEAGAPYVIDMKSKELDSYLRLENERGDQLMYDDDSGGGLDAQMKFRPTTTGVYRIIATTYHSGVTGAFSLAVRREGGAAPVGGALRVGAGGLNINVRLTAGDPRDRVRVDSHYKVFEVHLEEGRAYQIDLEGTGIDPYLRLETAAGSELAANDDFGGTLNSRIDFRPSVTGTYRIICTTYRPATGDMTLRVQEK
ncbi:MAG: PPC domain-containing protein [Gemmataceae bacterium]